MNHHAQDDVEHFAAAVALRVDTLVGTSVAHRIARLLERTDSSLDERRAIVALALTEMSARPTDARFIEWLFVIPLRHGLFRSRGRVWAQRRTVGPFQLRDGPLRLADAVTQVRHTLTAMGVDYTDSDRLAVAWNGPATGNTGRVKYASVLRYAMAVAKRDPSR